LIDKFCVPSLFDRPDSSYQSQAWRRVLEHARESRHLQHDSDSTILTRSKSEHERSEFA